MHWVMKKNALWCRIYWKKNFFSVKNVGKCFFWKRIWGFYSYICNLCLFRWDCIIRSSISFFLLLFVVRKVKFLLLQTLYTCYEGVWWIIWHIGNCGLRNMLFHLAFPKLYRFSWLLSKITGLVHMISQ